MVQAEQADWDADGYARFRDLRLRPALDLMARIGAAPAGDVVDLGCGDGAAAAALRQRFPANRLVGVDASPAMLEKAGGYDAVILGDIAGWEPEAPPAVIFSNAALQWLGGHERLLPRLAGLLAPGGTLAVQMPRQFDNPSHRLAREIAAAAEPERFGIDAWVPPVGEAGGYHRLLQPLGAVDVWETEYVQRLAPVAEGHPVRAFTETTLLRRYAAELRDYPGFLRAYDAALHAAYPPEADGAVLFPFRRLFLVLTTA